MCVGGGAQAKIGRLFRPWRARVLYLRSTEELCEPNVLEMKLQATLLVGVFENACLFERFEKCL
jgi:hypothetical protein